MILTPTQLRSNIYQVLDQVLATGEPVEIRRKGRILRIVPESPKRRLDQLTPRPEYLKVFPDEIVHVDWSHLWKP